MHLVLLHCWLADRKGIRPVKITNNPQRLFFGRPMGWGTWPNLE